MELTPVRRDKRRVARRLAATLAPSEEAMRAGDVQHVTLLHADAVAARELLRAGSCDVIVTDTPYGWRPAAGRVGEPAPPPPGERNTLDLLARRPGWVQSLRRGGRWAWR